MNTQTSNLSKATPSLALVVDDEPAICWAFERLLTEEGHRVVTASTAEEGLRIAAQQHPSMVFLDVRLPRADGISMLPKFLEATGNAPIIVMTAFGDLETAVRAVRSGASDYLVKPFKLEDAIRVCRNAVRASASQPTPMAISLVSGQDEMLIGRSPAMQQAFRQIALVADSDISVLITGETGSGKELVAAAIHRHSRRSTAPYLQLAPVTLNPSLVESELFGHVKGAFTGASEDRSGLFESATGGTILLDEIGDLPLEIQVKLLRVLEKGQFSRVGEVQLRTSNVRVIAATNCDLSKAVEQGNFREDLYYRLNGIHIHLPPLRERIEDIPLLCTHFLTRIGYPAAASAIDETLMDALLARKWYGNIRELKNAIQSAAVTARGRSLVIGDFPEAQPGKSDLGKTLQVELDKAVASWTREQLDSLTSDKGNLYEDFLKAVEPVLFRILMQHTGDNKAKTADLLGMHRSTLRERLRGYEG